RRPRPAPLIEPGAKAPAFTLASHRGEDVSLSDFARRRLALCFFPNAFSPVCSDQFSTYVPVAEEIQATGVEVLGVSTDGSWTLRAFRKALEIPFTLLSDFHPKAEMSTAYGAYLADWGTTNRSV